MTTIIETAMTNNKRNKLCVLHKPKTFKMIFFIGFKQVSLFLNTENVYL